MACFIALSWPVRMPWSVTLLPIIFFCLFLIGFNVLLSQARVYISCDIWLGASVSPEGSLSVLVGRHGAMKPVGKVGCNTRT